MGVRMTVLEWKITKRFWLMFLASIPMMVAISTWIGGTFSSGKAVGTLEHRIEVTEMIAVATEARMDSMEHRHISHVNGDYRALCMQVNGVDRKLNALLRAEGLDPDLYIAPVEGP